MSNIKYTKIAIFVMAATLLSTAALVINPGRMAYAQSNVTGTDVKSEMANSIIKILKENHPALATLAAEEDKDLLVKIKVLDAKEAVKTALALNIIRLLQQYKQVDEAP